MSPPLNFDRDRTVSITHATDTQVNIADKIGGQPTKANGSPRQCQGISKKTGERCTAVAAQGGNLCAGHAGLGKLDAKLAAARSAEVRHAKAVERSKSLKDRLAEDLEAHADEILAAFLAGVRNEGWRAAKEWIEQVHGKPKQALETEDLTKQPADMGMGELIKAMQEAVKNSS